MSQHTITTSSCERQQQPTRV